MRKAIKRKALGEKLSLVYQKRKRKEVERGLRKERKRKKKKNESNKGTKAITKTAIFAEHPPRHQNASPTHHLRAGGQANDHVWPSMAKN